MAGNITGQGSREPGEASNELAAGLQRLSSSNGAQAGPSLFARLRNYFLAGLVIVGPILLTLYLLGGFILYVDNLINPLIASLLPPPLAGYFPLPVPGIGLIVAIILLTLVGALAANLFGRTLIGAGEVILGHMPIVRNVYRALKQMFQSVVSATTPAPGTQKIGLIQHPATGLWSLVFVTGEPAPAVSAALSPSEGDLITVFMPTGFVPPTGFTYFVPRRSVTLIKMSMEDAAKIIISGGMVAPGEAAKPAARTEATKSPFLIPR